MFQAKIRSLVLVPLVMALSVLVSGCGGGEASPAATTTSTQQEAKPDSDAACSSFREKIGSISEISREELFLLMADVFAGVDSDSIDACMKEIDQDFELTCTDVCTIKPRN